MSSTAVATPPPDLSAARTQDLLAFQNALQSQRIAAPVTRAKLRAAGLKRLCDFQALFEGLRAEQLVSWLGCVLSERTRSQGPQLELVWTGPELPHTVVRDTAKVVRDLFAEATSSVLVGGCYFSHGEAILKPLYEAIRDRGVQAVFCIDMDGKAPNEGAVVAHVRARVREFIGENWPFGPPLPRFFYYPRAVSPQSGGGLLHSKCVVVDERVSFLTSANFTYSGQSRNIETGVRIEDAAFGKELSRHWHSLIEAGVLQEFVIQPGDIEGGRINLLHEAWEGMREYVAEEYHELFNALKAANLPAPDDAVELQYEGRVTGETAIMSWENDGEPVALVLPGTRADGLTLVEATADAEAAPLAEQLRALLEAS